MKCSLQEGCYLLFRKCLFVGGADAGEDVAEAACVLRLLTYEVEAADGGHVGGVLLVPDGNYAAE